jgi:hypothetical protein
MAPPPVADIHLDAKQALRLIVPFADIGDPAKHHRESEPDRALIEALLARAKSVSSSIVYR